MADKYNYKIGLYRLILMILVIIGHSAIIASRISVDNMANEWQYNITGYVCNLIYSFHMPAFLMLTGYLYRQRGRFSSLKKIQSKLLKFAMLVILIQNLTFLAEIIRNSSVQYINLLNTNNKIAVYAIDALLYQSHAWYLQCYILCYIVQKIFEKLQRTHWEEYLTVLQSVVFFLVCINNMEYLVNIPRVADIIAYNSIWFCIGTLVDKYCIHRKLYEKLRNNTLLIQIISMIWILQVPLPKGFCHLIQGISGQLVLYYFVNYTIQHCNRDKWLNKIKKLDEYSFTAYVYGFIFCVWYQAIWILINLDSNNEVYWSNSSVITYFIGQLIIQFILIYAVKYIVDSMAKKRGRKF